MKTAWHLSRMARILGLGVVLGHAAIGLAHAQARVTVGFADGPIFSSTAAPFFLDEAFSSTSVGSGEVGSTCPRD